jgi:VPDSG-CTERM motif
MKTKAVSSRLALFAISISAALVTQPAVATIIDTIQMTENSPTSLSVTLNGLTTGITVQNTSADHWTITFPTNIVFHELQIVGGVGWIEPENSANGNIVSSPSGNNQLFVVSDALGHPFSEPDGTQVGLGTDNSNPLSPVAVAGVFTDMAATAEATVPDIGTTGSLLGLSLAGLVFLRRKLC